MHFLEDPGSKASSRQQNKKSSLPLDTAFVLSRMQCSTATLLRTLSVQSSGVGSETEITYTGILTVRSDSF